MTSVSFGIETATANPAVGTQPVTVDLYIESTGTFPTGDRIQVATTTVDVTNQADTVLNVPLAVTVPAGTTQLIMEVFTPDGQAPANNSFFIGSNALGQTGPSYFSTTACAVTTPTDLAALGYPNMNIIFNVNGNCGEVAPTVAAQVINLSTRLLVGTGNNVGIGGFIITGSAPKQVLLRAIGPSLSTSGVPNLLVDPVMELHGPSSFTTIMNDNWRDGQEAEIIASGVPPTDDRESAIFVTLDPGAYTAIVSGNGSTSGVGLVEIYDLSPATASKLANISTRAVINTGSDIVIAGFILDGGSGSDSIVIRGLGPSLDDSEPSPVPVDREVLSDPTLELRNSQGALVIANDNWQDDSAQAEIVIADGLAPSNNFESAIVATLVPGAYTALLTGANSGTGLGLVEVYDNPVSGP